jgi:small subunit ribosomal protein S20
LTHSVLDQYTSCFAKAKLSYPGKIRVWENSGLEEIQENLHFMPKHKSAEKRDRQNARRNAINTANRTRLRTQIKKMRTVIAAGDAQQAKALLPKTISLLDKAVQDGVLHRNTAARHKSRLTLHINELSVK